VVISTVTNTRVVKLGGKDCKYAGSKICNGAVTKEIGTKLVKICIDGKIKTRTTKSVSPDYPLVGRDTGPDKDCVWYGTVFCDGDLVEDLFRWTFRHICSKTKFSTIPRTYEDVVGDRRFKLPKLP